MEKIFVDTDICVDLLTGRRPFHLPAAQFFSMADRQKILLGVSSLSFSNIHYILRQEYSAGESRAALMRFKSLAVVLPVNEKIVNLALQSDFKDFEDALQYYTAIEAGMKTIITRNTHDYKRSVLPVMTASEYLKSF